MIERILREHNLRTGRFTSPHLVHINERIALDGVPVEDERLASVWDDIQPALEIADRELLAAGEAKLTFFEALAVLAFAVFAVSALFAPEKGILAQARARSHLRQIARTA